MSELSACLNELINDVKSHAQAYHMSYREAFFEKIKSILSENGDVLDLTFSEFESVDSNKRIMRADGYSIELEDDDDSSDASNVKELTLIVADFAYDAIAGEVEEIQTINTGELGKKFSEMERFVHACSTPDLKNNIAETSKYKELVNFLTKNFKKLEKITLIYATTSRFSGRIKEFEALEIKGIKINKQIYDLSRHHAIITSNVGSEPTVIEFEEHGFNSLEVLRTDDGGNTQSYLLAVPGDLLFRIYEEHGARLLEQNVRTYLQAKGNVNKGMIATLRENPERFFSYNNGLTATASDIMVEHETKFTKTIKGIQNLQIVNGGQTTASIHYAKFKHGADLSRVFVQMKLSIVAPDLLESIVPKIAQYANTQNKVNAADFFANHPFHRQFELLARKNPTPKLDNAISSFGTYWYYERARGAYNNETYRLQTASAKKEFSSKYPKTQLILKTDLAKYLMSFDMHPDVVSKGGQAAFVQHASTIGLPEKFQSQSAKYNDMYFRHSISKTIIFRELEKIVSQADWYEGGGSRACTITYSIAWFSHFLHNKDLILDFEKIWKIQSMPGELRNIFEGLMPEIYEFLKNSTPPTVTAVPQWAKRKGCWDGLKKEFLYEFDEELLEAVLTTKELHKEIVKGDRKTQIQYKKSQHLVDMMHLKPSDWSAIRDYAKKHSVILKPMQKIHLDRLADATERELNKNYIKDGEAKELLPLFGKLKAVEFDFERYNVGKSLYEG